MSPRRHTFRVVLTETAAWRRAMVAAVDLLAAVEEADQALLPSEVAEKAAVLREAFRAPVAPAAAGDLCPDCAGEGEAVAGIECDRCGGRGRAAAS